MCHTLLKAVSVLFMMVTLFAGSTAIAAEIQEGKLYVFVERYYGTRDNPLHSEFIINNKTVDIFSSDTIVPIDGYLKPGWNDITIKTVPQEPANEENDLVFKIGPMVKDPSNVGKLIMKPVLWKFRNGTDWEFKDGSFTHRSGPNVKAVTLNYHVFWGGFDNEGGKLQNGDYVLNVESYYSTHNSPILTTVAVNGTPLSSFLGSKRQVVLNSLLKPGKNEIRVITHKVENAFKDNDIEGEISGPAMWSPGKNKFLLKSIVHFNGMQGWKKNEMTGQLSNPENPKSVYIERTIPFMVKGLEEEPTIQEPPSAPEPQFDKSSI